MQSARAIILSLLACLALLYFSTLSHKWQIFKETFTYLLAYLLTYLLLAPTAL